MSREIQERADVIMRELREALVPIRREMRRISQRPGYDDDGPGME
ncbi:MAG: hypothetical protein QM472_00550 [Spirochaetota bacterium]|nr:hypothetical protein [Spirochaetota bacterium]